MTTTTPEIIVTSDPDPMPVAKSLRQDGETVHSPRGWRTVSPQSGDPVTGPTANILDQRGNIRATVVSDRSRAK